MKIKNVIIFAAGKGTRMAPITQHTPKPLIKVHGERIIERNVKFLIKAGLKNIKIVTGYLGDQFNFLKEKYDVELINNKFFDETNNISSLSVSKELWGGTLYLEGDIYLKDNIIPQLIDVINSEDNSVMFGAKVDESINEWKFKTNKEGFVVDHNPPAKAGDKIWTGIMFVNDNMGKLISKNIDKFFKKNKQKYFEQFLWTLDEKFVLKEINKDSFFELDNFSDLIKIDGSYATQDSVILFTPGPTNIPRNLWDAVSQGVVHHRSTLAEFYISTLTNQLKEIFSTNKGFPLLVTSSGTGAMEAAAINVVKKNDKVVVIKNGDFGERFSQILKAHKIKHTVLDYGFGKPIDLNNLEKKLKGADVVFLTHHETSAGILNPVKKISKIVKDNNALFIVDSISSIVTEEFKFDDWNIDVALASSPKAFALTPGISFICISEKAKKIIMNNDVNSFYFDLKKYIEYYESYKQTPFTPAISLIIGMIASIEEIQNKTIHIERKKKDEIYNFLNNGLSNLGFINGVDESSRTRAMLSMFVPKGISARDLRERVSIKHRIYFEIGRRALADSTIRIGILGPVNMDNAKDLLKAIEEEINKSK